jgi:hypothetical protein
MTMTMTKIEALELALANVRCYNDRMYLQFLINVERRKQMLTKEQLLRDGFTLEQYPDGLFWARRVHDELFIQVDEAITEVSLYQNGWVDNGLSLAEYHSAVHQFNVMESL